MHDDNEIDDRSISALDADNMAEKLMEQRVHVSWLYQAILIVVVGLLYYFDQPGWLCIVFAIGWLGVFMANELKLIYHELIELNDQLTGRKDEFKKNISNDE